MFWTPEMTIENAIQIQENTKYKFEIIEKEAGFLETLDETNINNVLSNLTVKVTEMRKLRGIFYERLELNQFPIDLQELSVKLSSQKSINEAILVENTSNESSVDRANFFEQQQWDLFDCVKVTRETYNDYLTNVTRFRLIVSAYVVRKHQFYIYKFAFFYFTFLAAARHKVF